MRLALSHNIQAVWAGLMLSLVFFDQILGWLNARRLSCFLGD
jgi:hypothetical protein